MSDDIALGDWVRHKQNGMLGQVIEEEGELLIKPDSPLTPVRYPRRMFGEWHKEPNARKIPVSQLASVMHAADRALCAVHPEMKRQPEWLSLDAETRKQWIDGSIKLDHPLRILLKDAVTRALDGQ